MKYGIIGCGRLGVAVTNAMMMKDTGNTFSFYEPLPGSRIRFGKGEFREMEMVAHVTGNRVELGFPDRADIWIITAGKPRTSSKQEKGDLLKVNLPIVRKLVRRCKKGKIYIATNPPKELCAVIPNTLPLRECVDELRRELWGASWKRVNDQMLNAKGYTSYGPAAAMAKEVLQWAHVR